MDVDDPDPNPSLPKTSLFLGCFGRSGKGKRQDSIKIADKVHHRSSRLFPRSTFFLKQSPDAKTVPLYSSNPEKIHHIKNSMFKFKKSRLNKNPAGDIPLKPQITPAVKLPVETKPSFEKEVTIENGKFLDNKKGHRTPKNVSFCRRIDSIRNASSQPGSPDPNTKSNNRIKISRSTSFPVTNPTVQTRVGAKKPGKESTNNKLDAVVGMSIIMVTLVIIMIWGRLCAIICTCTWLYFVPRLRKNGEPGQTLQNGLDSEEPDFDSEEYKKRVVLVGFLERNHNRSIG